MMLAWSQHLILVPIVLPLICGALLILINESRHQLKFAINYASMLAMLAISITLVSMADSEYWQHGIGVYLAANWSAPFGIALLADRLSAMMLVLTSILGTAALMYSMSRWSRLGVHFHSLFQFLMMGINGAFLTHDLFNLFVFFEVMLAASYGLILHGYNTTRVRAGMQYIAINLTASLLFLIGVALIYASTGTLNMADLAARMPWVQGLDMQLLQIGVSILALAFLIKSAMWPLGFWLPTTYAAAAPPVAAMVVLMTKVGVYAILRIWLLVFSSEAGEAAGFGLEALTWGGIVTIVFGAAGMLAAQDPGRMAGYAAIVSSGTMLAILGYGQPSLIGPMLYYLIGSTIAVAALMLLIELINRISTPGAAVLALTIEAFAVEEVPEETAGVRVPAALAFLGLSFSACALIISGLPPLSGFLAKFTMFHQLLSPTASEGLVSPTAWTILILIVVAGFSSILGLMRFGVRTFWASGAIQPPRLLISEVLPIGALLGVCLALAVMAGPALDYLDRVSDGLHRPTDYVERVLAEPVVPGAIHNPVEEAK